MRKVITATEGHILTNGEIYGTEILLAEGLDGADFYEITLDEYNAQHEAEHSEEATEDDYRAALNELGVSV